MGALSTSEKDNAVRLWNSRFTEIKKGLEGIKRRIPLVLSTQPIPKIKKTNTLATRIYSRVDFKFTKVGPAYRSSLIDSLRKNIKGSPIKAIKFEGKGGALIYSNLAFSDLSAMPETAIFASRAIAQQKYRGQELDVILQDTEDHYWAVTVQNNYDHLYVKAIKNPKPFSRIRFGSVSQAKNLIESKYPIGKLIDGNSRWTILQLQNLELALSFLGPNELKAIEGLEFVRVKIVRGNQAKRAAVYHRHNSKARIEIGDKAVRSGTYFIGDPERPIIGHSMVYLHEIGHALANRYVIETYKVFEYWQKMRRDYDQLRGRLSEDQVRLLNIYNPFDLLTQKQLLSFNKRNPILDRYRRIPGAILGPTSYGKESVSESFAEAFALFHLDPLALRRVSPGSYVFFKSGRHIIEGLN